MYYLVVNCGSTSLKLDLVDSHKKLNIFTGEVDRIKSGALPKEYKKSFILLYKKIAAKFPDELASIGGVCHRVVHGGTKYSAAIRINAKVKQDISRFSTLAPLHNPYNLIGIEAAEAVLPQVPHYAVFDTAFHTSIPDENAYYALPHKLSVKYGLRKYGFHGINHEYVSKKVGQICCKKNLKVISCHLGGGCSVAAIDSGISLDCSMGFTPLSGVPMATRSGDIDLGIVFYMYKNLGYSLDKIEDLLLKKSGLLGLSGFSGDMRDLLHAKRKHKAGAERAINFFALEVAKKIMSQLVLLKKVDVIIFTAGIGEHGVRVRQLITDWLSPLGVKIDQRLNADNSEEITAKNSAVRVFVITANEALQIAADVNALITSTR